MIFHYLQTLMFIAIAWGSKTNTISIAMTMIMTTDLMLDGFVTLILQPFYVQGHLASLEV